MQSLSRASASAPSRMVVIKWLSSLPPLYAVAFSLLGLRILLNPLLRSLAVPVLSSSIGLVGGASTIATIMQSPQLQSAKLIILHHFRTGSAAMMRTARPLLQDSRLRKIEGAQLAAGFTIAMMLVATSLFRTTPSTPLPGVVPSLGSASSDLRNEPSLQRPFIYIHVPGSGGISFRKALFSDATKILRSTKFLPCYSGLRKLRTLHIIEKIEHECMNERITVYRHYCFCLCLCLYVMMASSVRHQHRSRVQPNADNVAPFRIGADDHSEGNAMRDRNRGSFQNDTDWRSAGPR